jgi:4-hydroxy-tetrahydrodipicolinate synthase
VDPVRHRPHVPALTPFDGHGRVDEDRLRRHLAWLASADITIGLCGGGSGEGHLLSPSEVEHVLRIAIDELGAAAHLRALGKEPHTAAEAISFIHLAQEIGYRAVHLYSADAGHGSRLTERELELYFSTVLGETSAEVTLSAVNPSSGQPTSVDVLVRLTERFDNIVSIACATSDVSYLRALIGAMSPAVGVVSGGANLALVNLAMGGAGFGCAEGNIEPQLVAGLQSKFVNGEWDAAAVQQGELGKLSDLVSRFGGVRALKSLMSAIGDPMGEPRAPFLPLTDGQSHELADELAVIKLRMR